MSHQPPQLPPSIHRHRVHQHLPWLMLTMILALGAVLRYLGIFWGLPDSAHIFSYHPDEFHSLRGALSLILGGDLNPHFFNYGSLYLYLVSLAALLADSSAVGNMTAEGLTQMLRDWTIAARNVNLVCALLTILVVYFTARSLFGRRLGVLAAFTMAVLPLHVLHSDYATVDVPQTLFIALALLFSVKIGKRPRTADYLYAGLFAGLAASVKYNGGLVLIAPLIAHFVAARDEETEVPLLSWQPLAMILLSAVAFAATSPYTFLDWSNASRDITYEVQHMRAGEEPARSADPSGFLFHALGLTITTCGATIVALIGIIGLFVRRAWRPALGLLVFAVVWFAMISLSNVRYGRYEVPLTPVLAILVAAAPFALYLRRAELRLLSVVLPAAVIGFSLGVSLIMATTLRNLPDPRDTALSTIMLHVPPARNVGLAWEPWFNAPPLDRCNGGQVLRSNPLWSQFKAPVRPLVITGVDPQALSAQNPFAFALSNFEIRDALRIKDQRAIQFRNLLRDRYIPADVLQRPAPLSGLLGWVPPQDWLYPFPTETVYVTRVPAPPARPVLKGF
jgi:4-amino-4-deoxy-L-arabinose transferase-like glycosyltransferase